MLPGRDGQPVGDQPQRGQVDAEAEVTAADFDVLVPLGFRLDAGLPGHHAVKARVHRGGRDADGPGPLIGTRHPGAVRVQVAVALVGAVDVALPRVLQGEGAAQGDDLPDLPGMAARQFPGVDAAQAPADQRYRASGPPGMVEQRTRQPGQHLLGRPAVAAEIPAAHLVTQVGQELPQHERAGIGGQQSRQDQHPVAVTARRGGQPGRGQRQRGQVGQPAQRLGREQPGRGPRTTGVAGSRTVPAGPVRIPPCLSRPRMR